MIRRVEYIAGRWLLAMLFFAGAVQKAIDPAPAQALLAGFSLPSVLVWPALAFNFFAAVLLVSNIWVRLTSLALAVYCIATSAFHLVPTDPWQMSIFVKNWAIAGGLLVLSSHQEARDGEWPAQH